jgi:hypothetical protein
MKPLRIAAFSHGSVGGNPAGVVITEMDARDYLGGWVGDVNTSLRHSWKGSCDCCAPTSLLSIAAVPHAAPLPSLPLARINEIGVAIMCTTLLDCLNGRSNRVQIPLFGLALRDAIRTSCKCCRSSRARVIRLISVGVYVVSGERMPGR